MPAPRVSVIIPSYNHRAFVGAAIESVLSQSFQDFEIIITDDCSTDGTTDVIRSYGDPRIDLVVFDSNRGAAEATNFCIERARGEYIALLNSDDIFLPGKLERQVFQLDAKREIGAVFGGAKLIDDAGLAISSGSADLEATFKTRQRDRFSWLRHFFFFGNALCHPTVMIRKSVYGLLGGYDPLLRQLPDLDMWVRVCSHYEIEVIDEALTGFRLLANGSNVSAPSPAQRRRSAWETTLIHRRYRDMDAATLQQAFECDFHDSGAWSKETPLVRLALLCVQKADSALQLFGLATLDHAMREGDVSLSPSDMFDVTGQADPFAIDRHDAYTDELKRASDYAQHLLQHIEALDTDATALRDALRRETDVRILDCALAEQRRVELEKAADYVNKLLAELKQRDELVNNLKGELERSGSYANDLVAEIKSLESQRHGNDLSTELLRHELQAMQVLVDDLRTRRP